MATDYHESELSPQAREIHRALATVIEELEAVDWYHQRADATGDEALRAVVLHNRNEEIEHAIMALEWLRRVMPEFDMQMKTYLFTTAPITEIEAAAEGAEGTPVMAVSPDATTANPAPEASGPSASPSYNIGKFKKGS